MRAKTIKELLNEFGGAGYSYGGGSSIFPSNRGGGINRGGFGGASNLGGPNMMYTYEIKPLNKLLQPEDYGSPEMEDIKLGNDISGFELNKRDKKLHVGSILHIEKAEDGSLKYYVIMNTNTAQPMKIDPTTAQLISKLDGINPLNKIVSTDRPDLVRSGQISENVNKVKLLEYSIWDLEKEKDKTDLDNIPQDKPFKMKSSHTYNSKLLRWFSEILQDFGYEEEGDLITSFFQNAPFGLAGRKRVYEKLKKAGITNMEFITQLYTRFDELVENADLI